MADQVACRVEAHGHACPPHPLAQALVHPVHWRAQKSPRDLAWLLGILGEKFAARKDLLG
jgi:hypothetical protein